MNHKKSFLVFFTALIFLSAAANAQLCGNVWTQEFGGISDDIGAEAQQTSDGGFISIGTFNNVGDNQVYLVKTFADGTIDWTSAFGSLGQWGIFEGNQTSDGGYIMTGGVNSAGMGGPPAVVLIKTDSSGNETWSKSFSGSVGGYAESVAQTSDGGYVITGDIQDPFIELLLLKTDSSGNEQWRKKFGESAYNIGHSVKRTNDGGFIIAGGTGTAGGGNVPNAWLIKTDSLGNEQWNKPFGGIGRQVANSVQQTSDGGYIIAGFEDLGAPQFTDFLLLKTDSLGNQDWNKTFGGIDREEAESVWQTSDGGYIIAGWVDIGRTFTDLEAWIVKTDSNGNEEWNKRFGSAPNVHLAYSVRQTSDQGYIITGQSGISPDLQLWLKKTDSYGNDENICPVVCGDGTIVDPPEECDDGNTINDDACPNTCLNNVCGDGYIYGPPGTEQCDDGNLIDGDGCSSTCQLEAGFNPGECGNTVRELGEQCDDGANGDDTDQCTDSCTLTVCGDGIIQPLNGNGVAEQCDDPAGNFDLPNKCRTNCQLPLCGDNIIDNDVPYSEDCDDGITGDLPNDSTDDGPCIIDQGVYDCKTAKCGDGYLDLDGIDNILGNSDDEQCDDGNQYEQDGCNNACTIVPVGFADIIEVGIGGISNQLGEETAQFNAKDSLIVKINVTNKLSFTLSQKTLNVTLSDAKGNSAPLTIPFTQDFPPGVTVVKATFPLAGYSEKLYDITASMATEEGEENFYLNNKDKEFIAIVTRKATDTIEAPETSSYLVALTALAVIALIYFSSKRHKIKNLIKKHKKKTFKKNKK